MGKGMQETNECSRQESGNVGETIVLFLPHKIQQGVDVNTQEREGRGV